MNRRAKWLALAAVCLALMVALFWQRTRMEKLRAENAELKMKLAAAQVDVPREEAMAIAPASPDPELLRLRAEVAELRRQTSQVARAAPSRMVPQTKGAESAERPFETRVQHNTWGMMRLVLAMR